MLNKAIEKQITSWTIPAKYGIKIQYFYLCFK